MPGAYRPDRASRLAAACLTVAAALALVALLLPAGPRNSGDVPRATLVVADLRGGALIVVDAAAPASARRIALPGGPHEVLQLPDGRLVASLEQRGSLAILDPAGDAMTTLEVGGLPHGLAFGGGVLYVTDRASGALRRWQVADWSELPPQPAGSAPHAVALLANGAAAVADAGASTLRLGTATHVVGELPETVAVDRADGRVAVAAAGSGEVELFDAAGTRSWRVSVGGRPVRAAFGADGTLAVALAADGAVALIDGAGGVRRVAVGGVLDGLAFDAGGRWLYASDLHGRLAVIDVAGAHLHTVIDLGGGGALLVLAPPARPPAPAAAVRQ